MKWNIGCSGFHYKHWKGTFYPEELPQSRWFQHYCTFFNTIELNVTFYRFPRVHVLRNWYQKSPPNFFFAVKAPRAITHFKQFTGTASMMSDFYQASIEGLGEKLGCFLFQLPPRLPYSEARLEKILLSLNKDYKNVLEFRHPSWWNPEVYQKLSLHGVSFCGMSHPSLPADLVVNAPLVYYRLHGAEGLYSSSYSDEQLSSLAQMVQASPEADSCYIYFNNDVNSYAAYNAQRLTEIIKELELK